MKTVVEDFSCGHCASQVVGSGRTNHCPECLWSRHVDDQDPGDRASDCGGLMEPVGLVQKAQEVAIVHVCTTCGQASVNKTAAADNSAVVAGLAGRPVPDALLVSNRRRRPARKPSG